MNQVPGPEPEQAKMPGNKPAFLSLLWSISLHIGALHLTSHTQEKLLAVLQKWFTFLLPTVSFAHPALALYQLIIIFEIHLLHEAFSHSSTMCNSSRLWFDLVMHMYLL